MRREIIGIFIFFFVIFASFVVNYSL